jgi:hypothetical protein
MAWKTSHLRGVVNIQWERSESSNRSTVGYTISSDPEIENDDLAELLETMLETLKGF